MIGRAVCPVMIGREEELSVLEDALLAACRGEGSVVVLAGDAGMGKSRLCAELVRRADKIGAAVMEGSCSEAELSLPYLPFLEAVGNWLAGTDLAALRERVGPAADDLGHLFPRLSPERGARAGEGSDAKLRVFEGVLALLEAAAEERGLLLVLEDLHWADASTRELLDYLTRRLRTSRVLVLATYRIDEMHRRHPLLPTVQSWQRSRLAQLVELEPLGAEGVARMVSAIFDDTDVGIEFRDFIHTRSEGNPFVLEEMLKSALDRGDIYRDGRDWQRRPLRDLRIPETVRDTILLRVERLKPAEQDLLRAAAVLGRSFDHWLLARVCDQEPGAIEDAFEVLTTQQLLDQDSAHDRRYRFRHALTQEAIYDSLSVPRRERLHSSAANVLLESGGEAVEVARHLIEANRVDEAVPYCLNAADRAAAARADSEAAELKLRVLPHVRDPLERARVLGSIGESFWEAGDAARAIDYAAEAVADLDRLGRPLEAAHHRLILGRCQWEHSRHDLARAEFERARAALEDAGPSRDLAFAYFRLGSIAAVNFQAAEAVPFLERAIAVADEAGDDSIRVWSYNYLGLAATRLGRPAEGAELLERSYLEAAAIGRDDIAALAIWNLQMQRSMNLKARENADVPAKLRALRAPMFNAEAVDAAESSMALTLGDFPRALEYCRRYLAGAQEYNHPWHIREAKVFLGVILIEMGRLQEAEQYVPTPDPAAGRQSLTFDAVLAARFALAQGDSRRAAELAQLALDEDGGFTGYPIEVDAVMECLLAGDEVAAAERMLARLEAAGSPENPWTDRARARLLIAQGEAAAALPLAQSSVERFVEAGYEGQAIVSRWVLAAAHEATGDGVAAVSEWRQVVVESRRCGAGLYEQRAARALGEDLPPAPTSVEVPAEIGERFVTVMFADVRGYTSMTGQTAPAEMLDRISAYQRWAAQEVERHLGTVDKFAGDAVMATFNVSGAQVDHAEHALRAAQALRDKAALLGLPVGIGIATGAAVVGRLKDGANVSVLGETTNLAARLQGQARAGEILLSEETRRRLPDLKAESEQLELKGFEGLVTAYRVRA